MNFWTLLLWALFGLPGFFAGIALWKRNPVILDARKHQRLFLLIATIVLPISFLLGSSLFFKESLHWAWSIALFIGIVCYFIWHSQQKYRILSFFYFEKEEFMDVLETALKKAHVLLPGKPIGPFTFFRQYRTASQKVCVQIEYSRMISRFTVRLFLRYLPLHFDNHWIRTVDSLASNRTFDRVPLACVYYLSFGIGWIVFFVWLAILSL
ncbi:MAG: hypothetical protein PHI40_00520 [Caldisericia bacterium]|nr:hypothetical protein [Caldisericia bacterium]MDD4613882.1 hypothetical protein [Caldisericia bacterium]